MTRRRWAAAGVVAAGVMLVAVAVLLLARDAPVDPSTVVRRPLAGFGETALRVTTPAGETLDWCALLAATEAARRQGLAGQRDLRGYDAMVFRYDEPSTGTFWMHRTTLPLSIAWFDGEGRFVSATDMDPCPSDDGASCPTYAAARPYRLAIEVEQGDADRLGTGPGATVHLGGRCT